ILLRQKQKKLIMLPSETMIWQPEFTDKTLSRKPGAVQSGSWGLTEQMTYIRPFNFPSLIVMNTYNHFVRHVNPLKFLTDWQIIFNDSSL
ncbi:hypothetical protein, partial [Escherichia coli]|uniref:hypothetical protein n=1 Tax=Escherichia coli TaxID=562 RepID=UPI002148F81E